MAYTLVLLHARIAILLLVGWEGEERDGEEEGGVGEWEYYE